MESKVSKEELRISRTEIVRDCEGHCKEIKDANETALFGLQRSLDTLRQDFETHKADDFASLSDRVATLERKLSQLINSEKKGSP